MRGALIALLAAAVIAVIVGGVAMHRMVRDFNAGLYSDVSTPPISTSGLDF